MVGKKETVYQIVDKLQDMEKHLTELAEDFTENKAEFTAQVIRGNERKLSGFVKSKFYGC